MRFLLSFAFALSFPIMPTAQAAERYDVICLTRDGYSDRYTAAWDSYPEKYKKFKHLRQEKVSLPSDSSRREEIDKEIEALTPDSVRAIDIGGQSGVFSNLVRAKLKQGWSAQGGMSVASYVTGGQYQRVDFIYCQSFVK